jgi:hypothetical protein
MPTHDALDAKLARADARDVRNCTSRRGISSGSSGSISSGSISSDSGGRIGDSTHQCIMASGGHFSLAASIFGNS